MLLRFVKHGELFNLKGTELAENKAISDSGFCSPVIADSNIYTGEQQYFSYKLPFIIAHKL